MKEISSQLFTEEDYAIRAQAAKKVARNLMAKLVPEKETRLHLKNKNIGFNMRTLNEFDYALELIVQTDLQQTQNEEDSYNQAGIALVKGKSTSQLYVSLRPITNKVVARSVERIHRHQKMQKQ